MSLEQREAFFQKIRQASCQLNALVLLAAATAVYLMDNGFTTGTGHCGGWRRIVDLIEQNHDQFYAETIAPGLEYGAELLGTAFLVFVGPSAIVFNFGRASSMESTSIPNITRFNLLRLLA